MKHLLAFSMVFAPMLGPVAANAATYVP